MIHIHARLATKGRKVTVHAEEAGIFAAPGVIEATLTDGSEFVPVRLSNGSLLSCPIHMLSTTDHISSMMQEFSLRMLGDNFTLTRAQWEDLLYMLKPTSELYTRIHNLLKEDE